MSDNLRNCVGKIMLKFCTVIAIGFGFLPHGYALSIRHPPGLKGAPAHLPVIDGRKRKVELGQVDLDVKFMPSGWAEANSTIKVRGKKQRRTLKMRHSMDEMLLAWDGRKSKPKWRGVLERQHRLDFTSREYEFFTRLKVNIDEDWRDLKQRYRQPFAYKAKGYIPAMYSYFYQMDEIDHWRLTEESRLNIRITAPLEYVELGAKIDCYLMDWRDPSEEEQVSGKLERKDGQLIFQGAVQLAYPSFLQCDLRGGPDFDEKNRVAQEELRESFRAKAKALAKKHPMKSEWDKMTEGDLTSIIQEMNEPPSKKAETGCKPGTNKAAFETKLLHRVVRQNINQVRYCFEMILARKPLAKGKIAVEALILPNGCASDVRITQDTVGDERLATCVASRFKLWTFPQPAKATKFSYPFVFNPM